MIKTTQEIYNEAEINYNIVKNDEEWVKVDDMIKLIEEDIKFQQSRLKQDFEKDKAVEWRIIGMKNLKSEITAKTDSKDGGEDGM